MSEAVDSLKKIQEGLAGEIVKIEPSDKVDNEELAKVIAGRNKTLFFSTAYKKEPAE